MKKLVFLGAYLVALASQPVMAQANGPEVVVVRTTDSFGELHIVITRGAGKTEVLDVTRKDIKQASNSREEALQQVFVKLMQEGFQLKGTGGGGYNYIILNTYIFTKGQ